MNISIKCVITEKGTHSFYIKKGGQDFFLFTQNYRKGVQDFFKNIISFDQGIDFSRARKNRAVLKTMEKIIAYTYYIERYYGITVYKKSEVDSSKSYKQIYA